MKSSIRKRTFNNSIELKNELETWFESRELDFFQKAFDILPKRWQQCVDSNGINFQNCPADDGNIRM